MYKSKVYNILFYFSLTLYLVGRCFEYTIWVSELTTLIKLIKIIAYLCVLPCIFDSIIWCYFRFKIGYIPYLASLMVFLVFLIVFGVNDGFVCFSFSFAAIKINKHRLFKYIRTLFLILLVSIIICGIFNGNIEARQFGNTRKRYSFGFEDSFSLQMMWMSIVTCIIIYKKNKTNLLIAVLLLVSLLLHLFCDARTAFISNCFLILFDRFLEKRQFKKKKYNNHQLHSNFILRHIFVILFVLFNVICWVYYKYSSTLAIALDGLFTGRISMTARVIRYINGGQIPIFPVRDEGFDLVMAGLSSLMLDSSYAQMLFLYGCIYSVVTLFMLDRFSSKIVDRKDVRVISIIVAVAINGMLQPTVLSILYNPTILLFFDVLLNKNDNNGEERLAELQ